MGKLSNIKNEIFTDKVIECKGNITEAYKQTYPDSSSDAAKSSASRLLSNDNVRSRIGEKLEAIGLGVNNLNQKLELLTQADKEVLNSNGEIVELRDNPTRLQAIQTAYKLHQLLGSDNLTQIDARRIEFNISPTEIKELGGIVEEIKKLKDSK